MNNKQFTEGTIRQLLRNDVYAGIIRRQKSYIPDPISGKKIINDGVLPQYVIEDAHEAILDGETYERVLAEHQRRDAMQNPVYPFTRKIKCGICGRNYSRVGNNCDKKRNARWLCRSKKDRGPNCGSQSFTEPKLQAICAELMETDGFDAQEFQAKVNGITVLAGGDVQLEFLGGEIKTWKMPPKPPKKEKRKQSMRPKRVFDGQIFCGMCGRRFGRSMSQTNDGGHIYWSCRTKRGYNETCDSVNYTDLQIREIFCRIMHQKNFDEDFFNTKVEKLIIQKSGSIDFYMKDGTVKTFETLKLRINVHENTDTDEFIGKVKCAVCGNTYHKYSCKGRFHYWACSGRWKVRTDCNAQNIPDCNLRTVSAYIMGMEEFDPVAFEQQIKEILVQKDGSLTFHFYDGRERTWERM